MVFDKSEGSAGAGRPVRKPAPRPQAIAPQTTIGTPARPASPGIVGFMGNGGGGQQRPNPRPVAKPTSSGQYSAAPKVSRPAAPAPTRPGPVQRPGFQQPAANKAGGGDGGRPKNQGKPSRPNRPRGGYDAEKGKGGQAPKNPPKEQPGATPTVGTPTAPSIDEYLMSDTAYQGGISQLMKDLADFQAGNQNEQNSVNSAFQTALQRMGQERTQALSSLEEDFAARGLLNSGLYADAVSDYDTQYNQQIGDLTTDNQNSIASLVAALQQQQGLNTSSQQALREQAIMNRAKQYGLM